MRRKLIIRFLLAYVLVSLCTQALSGSALVMLRPLGPPRFDASLSLWGVLQHSLINLGRNLTFLLLPGMDVSAVVGMFVSASILLAGAVLFARGPVADNLNLCQKVRRLSGDTAWLQAEEHGEPDMERQLDAVAVRIAAAEDALQARNADCQAAALLLDAAYAQIEVLVEAGSFPEGSGEAGLVQDALSKIGKANSKIAQSHLDSGLREA